MRIRVKTPEDRDWVDRILTERWGGRHMVVHGDVLDASALPALVAGDREGMATYAVDEQGRSAELVTLDALVPGRGIGTALVEALARRLGDEGVRHLRVTTTNDNLAALRFYQRRGFRIVAVRPGAVDEARRVKPSIPLVGLDGIPLRDEIELVRALASGGA